MRGRISKLHTDQNEQNEQNRKIQKASTQRMVQMLCVRLRG